MSSLGKFIISFDCEGKWGNADKINSHHTCMHTNNNLNIAYRKIVDILAMYEIKATFAFVAAFTMSQDEYFDNHSLFKDVPINGINWLSRFRIDSLKHDFDGWFNMTSFDLVQQTGIHEVACHGFSHLPLSNSLVSQSDFCLELESANKIAYLKNITFKTLVFPRNLVGHVDNLKDFGYIAYRKPLYPKPNKFTKFTNLLNEFNIFQKAQVDNAIENGLVPIPSGYFLNWRAHIRKYIPISISLLRWKSIIKDACKNGKVVHLWSHPHNFIDGDRQYELFEGILSIVADEVAKGNMISLTQLEYSQNLLSENLCTND